jgi:hypothetical protein
MPKAIKNSVGELSLTSSFVAGGFSYQVDPAESDFGTGKIGGKPLLFYRFEDLNGFGTEVRRINLSNSGISNTSIQGVLSSSIGSGSASNFPIYTTDTPYAFKFPMGESGNLLAKTSKQVRSLRFGQSRGVFDAVDPPFDASIRVDNVSPTTSVESAEEGADHVSVDISPNVIDAIFSTGGLTITAWIKPELLELEGTYAAPPPAGRIPIHTRPIFSLLRKSGGAKESLINFSAINVIKDAANDEYLNETSNIKLHRSLLMTYKNRFTGDQSSKVTFISRDRVVQEGEWQHVAIVVPPDDGTGEISANTPIRFYVNGTLIRPNQEFLKLELDVEPRALDLSVDKSEIGIELGGYNGNLDGGFVLPVGGVARSIGAFFIGNMDDVALWNRALEGDEVAAIFNARAGAYKPGSGYLNSSPRLIIRDRDNLPGLYPSSNVPPGRVLNGATFKEGD